MSDTADRQFQEWGVSVHTSNVRPVHIANGIVQLLRLAPDPPPWRPIGAGFVERYKAAVRARFGRWPSLPKPSKALCVTESKDGVLVLDAPAAPDDPSFMAEARAHFARALGRPISRDEH